MRGKLKTRTFGFLTSTLEAIVAAAQTASDLDRESLALLADASEKAAQYNRDLRQLTRNDGTGIVRVLVARFAGLRASDEPITDLQEAMLLQAMAVEQYLLTGYTSATDLANRAYRIVRPL